MAKEEPIINVAKLLNIKAKPNYLYEKNVWYLDIPSLQATFYTEHDGHYQYGWGIYDANGKTIYSGTDNLLALSSIELWLIEDEITKQLY